jgi:hypothetical protein
MILSKSTYPKQLTFSLIIIYLIIVRGLDEISTYLVTPNLKYETNPVVRVWQGGWFELLLMDAFTTTYFSLSLYFYFFRFTPLLGLQRGKFFPSMLFYYFYRESHFSWHKFLYTFPKNWIAILITIGCVKAYALMYFSLFAVLNNIGFYYYLSSIKGFWYELFVLFRGPWRMLTVIDMIILYGVIIWFWYSEYQKYRKLSVNIQITQLPIPKPYNWFDYMYITIAIAWNLIRMIILAPDFFREYF